MIPTIELLPTLALTEDQSAKFKSLKEATDKALQYLVDLGEVPASALEGVPAEFTAGELERWSMESATPAGRLRHLKPAVQLSETPPYWARPSVPLGHHRRAWT
jgi:hypothetical protein